MALQYDNSANVTGQMAIRRQDLFCLSLYYSQYSTIRNRFFRWRKIPVARILAFHDVPPGQIQAFREKMKIVQDMANVVSLSQLFSWQISWERLNVAITFDDGFRGWVDNVCPILKDFSMGATFFVSSGLVGLRDEEEQKFLRGNLRNDRPASGKLIDEDGLRQIAGEGFAIGGHTLSHVNLRGINDISMVRSEIERDKENLETITGTEVRYFAYPFGISTNVDIDLAAVLRESGYLGAVTLSPGLITSSTDSYFWHRDLVSAAMSPSVFKARLLGNYDGVMYVRRILRL